MHRRSTLALALAATVTLCSCSAVEDLTGPEPEPAPSASAEELLHDDVPVGTDWHTVEGQDLEDAVADHPKASQATIEPEECTDAALVTDDEDGQRAEIAGKGWTTEDGTALPVLAVVKDGRSVDDLREAREDCGEMTATPKDQDEDVTLEFEEEVDDGPEIDGADDSFELDGTYGTSTERSEGNGLERYGIVAEVRGVLVVVMANPDTEDEDSGKTHPINDATRAEAAEVVETQVQEVLAAR